MFEVVGALVLMNQGRKTPDVMKEETKVNANVNGEFDLGTISRIQAQTEFQQSQAIAKSAAEVSSNESAGFTTVTVDLSDAKLTAGLAVTEAGYEVTVSRQGSTSGISVDLSFDGTPIKTVKPGSKFRGKFDRIVISNPSQTTGAIKLVITKKVDGCYEEDGGDGLSMTPSQKTMPALYNSALNIPSLATDGIALSGTKGCRVSVKASGAATITSGNIRYWWFDGTNWGLTTQIIPLTAAINSFATLDEIITVGYGRIFAELQSYADSTGATAPTCTLTVS